MKQEETQQETKEYLNFLLNLPMLRKNKVPVSEPVENKIPPAEPLHCGRR